MTTELEHLRNAPIDEVSCGIIFETIDELDPLVVGSYWSKRANEYPQHALRVPYALFAPHAGAPPVRSLITSKDDQFVLQVQADRFMVNWRRRDAQYPRFNDRDGKEGILGRTLREFGDFDAFCEATFGKRLTPKAIELAKIDVIREGTYWKELKEIAQLFPSLRDFLGFTKSTKPSFILRFNEVRSKGMVYIGVALGETKQEAVRVLTLDTRTARQLGSASLKQAFTEANEELNEVFAGLIPKEQRGVFFGAGGPT